MNGLQLNREFNNPTRMQIFQQETDISYFEGLEHSFLDAVLALQVQEGQQIIPAVYSIIDKIVGDNDANRNTLINFANSHIESTFQVQSDELDIEDIANEARNCTAGGGCDGCAGQETCHA